MAAAKTATPTVQNKMITVEEAKGDITNSGRLPRAYLMERCGLQ